MGEKEEVEVHSKSKATAITRLALIFQSFEEEKREKAHSITLENL